MTERGGFTRSGPGHANRGQADPGAASPGQPKSGLAIEASGLAKSYRDVRVLSGVDLRVPSGTVFALLGPNGAGKTTTVRILATLVQADARPGPRSRFRRRPRPVARSAARSASPGSSPRWTRCRPAPRTCA